MKFSVLALDYDDTIARDGILDPGVRQAWAAAQAACSKRRGPARGISSSTRRWQAVHSAAKGSALSREAEM
ncbi:MAG TPA: hypothetical protein VGN09_29395 [Vicinamibacteria bacterium]